MAVRDDIDCRVERRFESDVRTAPQASSSLGRARSPVAQAFQPPPTPYVRPAPPRFKAGSVAGFALIFAGFFVFMFGTLAAAVTGIVHPVLVAGLGFILMASGGGVMAMMDSGQERPVPAPPAVQPPPPAGPEVPRGSIEIPCPNCGAPPQNVDRFGVATCGYCQTRFLVR